MRSLYKQHAAVLTFPIASHPNSVFSIVRSLAAISPAGLVFSFLTSSKYATSLSQSVTTDNLRIFEISDGCPEGHVVDPEEGVRMFMEATPGNFKEGMEEAVEGWGGVQITCVISNSFLWFAADMAAEMEVPWVALWTGGPCSLSAHIYTDLLRRRIGFHEKVVAKEDEDLGFLPGLSGLRVCDLPEGVVSGNINGEFAKLFHRMATKLPRAVVVVLNSFQGLNTELDSDFTSKFKKFLPIGPTNLLNPAKTQSDPFNCIQWLDRHEPASVAYVSFGTVLIMRMAPSEVAELAEGLEASGIPFMWSLKDSARVHLPAGFLDRTREQGLVVSWAPQVDVLEHEAVGAFVTHCGWNSVLESVTCGVPMVCRPILGDQMLNARAVSHVWRVGVVFEGGTIKKNDVAAALETVTKGENGKMMRQRMGELKAKAIQAVQPDGSSIQNFKTLLEIVNGACDI